MGFLENVKISNSGLVKKSRLRRLGFQFQLFTLQALSLVNNGVNSLDSDYEIQSSEYILCKVWSAMQILGNFSNV